MLQMSSRVYSVNDLETFLLDPRLAQTMEGSRSVLVQLFWNCPDSAIVRTMADRIKGLVPKAVLVGCYSSGQITDGFVVRTGVVVSVACFSHARLEPLFVDVEKGKEEETGAFLAAALARTEGIKGVLIIATALSIDASTLIAGVRREAPSLVVFGGSAAHDADGQLDILFDGRMEASGLVAVGMAGEDLEIEVRTLFDWKFLGPPLELTELEDGCVRRIDGKPAFEHYRKILGIEDRNDLYLLEFPLLIERNGLLIARNTLSAEADGGVRLGADAYSGECARLGYLDMDALGKSVTNAVQSLRGFRPQAIFLYSCVCRLFTLQDVTAMETLPFQGLAPTAGVFTSGELCRYGGSLQLLNSSEVVVAMREGPAADVPIVERDLASHAAKASNERHMRITSLLFRFITSITERLGAEVVERKRAEEEAREIAKERERLLREFQHRVKNSMAMISGIASIESHNSGSQETRAALQKIETRIGALASLYDLLYVTGSIEEIELSDYLGRVVDSAATGHGADARGIVVERSAEGIRIDVKRAVSLGLMVNELVTNSLKYAFPEGRKGRISVRLFLEGGKIALTVEDDGVGVDEATLADGSGFGLTLVRSLAAQLDASLSMRNNRGLRVELRLAQ
jgi:two-component sensor histidine kinase